MKFTYEYLGQAHTLELNRLADGTLQAILGDKTWVVDASPLGDGRWLLRVDNRQVVAHTASDKESRYVQVNGTHYTLTRDNGRQTRKHRSSGGDTELKAQMPGQVMDVLVTDGDTVTSGQALVVLEAMKMEIRVTTPTDTRVKRVLVQKGQIVERGQTLVELDDNP